MGEVSRRAGRRGGGGGGRWFLPSRRIALSTSIFSRRRQNRPEAISSDDNRSLPGSAKPIDLT